MKFGPAIRVALRHCTQCQSHSALVAGLLQPRSRQPGGHLAARVQELELSLPVETCLPALAGMQQWPEPQR